MVTTLGTILGTTLGTELGGMQDVAGFDSRLLYALSSLSGSNWYETQAGGGEVGAAAGFGFIVLCRLHQGVASAARAIADNFYTSPIEGWTLNSTGTNNSVLAAFSSGAAASISTPAVALTPSDSGRILALVGQHTGAGATARLSVFRGSYVSQAITGYTAAAARKMAIGKRANVGNIPADGVDVIGKLTFRGVPSDAQIAAVLDAARNGMDLPTAFVGATLTHRISLRDVLAGLDLPVIDGQTAPASLPDTVTAASIDAMARQGSPTVRVIDPGVDGRKSYGATGFSTTNRLESAGAPLNGATVSVELELVFNTALASGKHIISNANGSSIVGGFSAYQSANTLNIFSYGPGVNASYTIPASYAGQLVTLKIEITGAVIRALLNGVALGADVAATYTASSRPLYVGTFGDGTSPSDNVSIYRVRGGTIAQPYLHDWNLTTDITANGGPSNGIPATVQDRIGTDHLTRVGGPVVGAGNRVSGFASTVYGQSAGVAAPGAVGGFNAAVLYEHGTTITLEGLFACSNGGATNGFALALHSADRLFALIGNGTAASVLGDSPQTYLTVGRHHIALNYNGTQAKIFVDGVLKQTLTVAYAVSTSPASIGSMVSGANPARPHGVYGAAYGATSATDGEIATAAAASIAAGSIVGVPGKTDKRWSVVDDVIEAGGKVPAIIRERVSGVDHMVVIGAPLQVAQRAERVWSYEATPIMHGVESFTDADTYSGTTGAGGDVAGFAGSISFMVTAAGASATRFLAASNQTAPSRGWDIRTSASNATISMTFVDNTNVVRASGSAVLGANAVGKIHVFSWCWDAAAGRWRVYLSRAEVGTGTTATGYAPTTGPLVLGNGIAGGLAATGIRIFGLTVATGIPTLAVMQAHYDAVMANDGRMVALPGLTTQQLIDVTQDAPSGGTAPATLTDRSGNGNNLTKNGSPTLGAQYARAFGW